MSAAQVAAVHQRKQNAAERWKIAREEAASSHERPPAEQRQPTKKWPLGMPRCFLGGAKVVVQAPTPADMSRWTSNVVRPKTRTPCGTTFCERGGPECCGCPACCPSSCCANPGNPPGYGWWTDASFSVLQNDGPALREALSREEFNVNFRPAPAQGKDDSTCNCPGMEEETNGGDCCTGWYWVCVPICGCVLFNSTCSEACYQSWLPNDTLLHRAVKTGASPAVIEVLLEAGYDPDAKNLEVCCCCCACTPRCLASPHQRMVIDAMSPRSQCCGSTVVPSGDA